MRGEIQLGSQIVTLGNIHSLSKTDIRADGRAEEV